MKNFFEISPARMAKKSIFILAALFAATFANAQITLEKTFDEYVRSNKYFRNGIFAPYVYGDLLWTESTDYNTDISTVVIYDAVTYEEITRFSEGSFGFFFVAARGYFSTTDEVNVLLCRDNQLIVLSESGEVLQNLGELSQGYYLSGFDIFTLSDGTCKLMVVEDKYDNGYSHYKTHIYSLPGNGKATAVSTPSSPKRSARKIVRDNQVLVQTDNSTYNLTGQELK